MNRVPLCIIGGGASGLVCAIRSREKATVIEKADRVGKKILLTGNGRCNLTNTDLGKNHYSSPDFYQKVYESAGEELALFMDSLGLFTRVDGAGRVYPHSNAASSVLDTLRFNAERGADIRLSERVISINPVKGGYEIVTDKAKLIADKVIYAVGGGEFAPLAPLGLKITKTCPMLCPIETETESIKGLDGVRAFARVSLISQGKEAYSESGEVLFRAYGVSGVAVFNCSACIARDRVRGNRSDYEIKLDLLDGLDKGKVETELIKRAKQKVPARDAFAGIVQRKIGERILKSLSISQDEPLKTGDVGRITKALSVLTLRVKDLRREGAQVTSGGVCLSELKDSMELKRYPNFFVVGEAVDMDGECGGYNLHWAFLSAVEASRRC